MFAHTSQTTHYPEPLHKHIISFFLLSLSISIYFPNIITFLPYQQCLMSIPKHDELNTQPITSPSSGMGSNELWQPTTA